MVITEKNLDACTFKKVLALWRTCGRDDRYSLPMPEKMPLMVDPDRPSHHLYVEEDQLVGYLQLWTPAHDEAEVVAWVLPNRRREGVFRMLIESATKALSDGDWTSMLLVTHTDFKVGHRVLKTLGAHYSHSELQMSRGPFLSSEMPSGELRPATSKEEDLFCRLDETLFQVPLQDARAFYRALSKDDQRQHYFYAVQNHTIGMGGIYKKADHVYLYGLGILKKSRGLGYGQALLQHLMNRVDPSLAIKLEVEADNYRAISLYRKMGFSTERSLAYYERSF